MKYIDNWKAVISADLRQQVLDTVGQARPRDWPAINAIESSEYKRAIEAGYDLNAVHWWVYEEQELGKLNLPFKEYHWWITKLYPSQFMPMHTDPHTHDRVCKRLWVPLQDFEPGHVFIYKDNMITNYYAYDVYEYYNSHDMHGAANIGHTPRVVLQVTVYE